MNSRPPAPLLEVSAGGLVVSIADPGKVALIRHRNRSGGSSWCIPKGHVEAAETLEETAIREVAEETGISGLVTHKLDTISYRFSADGRRIEKTVHHYLLQQIGGDLSFENDPTGEVTKVGWFRLDDLERVLTHSNERKVARIAIEILGVANN